MDPPRAPRGTIAVTPAGERHRPDGIGVAAPEHREQEARPHRRSVGFRARSGSARTEVAAPAAVHERSGRDAARAADDRCPSPEEDLRTARTDVTLVGRQPQPRARAGRGRDASSHAAGRLGLRAPEISEPAPFPPGTTSSGHPAWSTGEPPDGVHVPAVEAARGWRHGEASASSRVKQWTYVVYQYSAVLSRRCERITADRGEPVSEFGYVTGGHAPRRRRTEAHSGLYVPVLQRPAASPAEGPGPGPTRCSGGRRARGLPAPSVSGRPRRRGGGGPFTVERAMRGS